MSKKHVVVETYNIAWKQDFQNIKLELEKALGDLALSIEHVGSTSVEGLSAKPIIDIDVVIENVELLGDVIIALQKIGYTHEGDQGIPEGALKYPYDIDGYIAYKSGFIEQIYEKIGVDKED